MIIVQLKGGLGNQLFQYAAGLSLATHHGVDVKVDLTELRQPDEEIGTLRAYELNNISRPPAIASYEEIENIQKQNVFKKYLEKVSPSHKRTIYNEKQLLFDNNFFNSGSHIYLKGYRQSEKYFKHIENIVRHDFELKHELVANVKASAEQFSSINSVSIHVRRGDYTNNAVKEYHGSLDKDYYQHSIDKISSITKDPIFFIFSDDINWVKSNLKFTKTVKFVSGTISKNHYEDFYLMSRCKHNIIANSSFSWWASWLNPNPNKMVIAPKRWFNNTRLNTRDLIPEGWHKL
ncbi:alpha-1,2-fucosyltransferase [Segetibacter aerophilus]|uniref:Alpha-1,2-fucosyltransferase n=1 Tax=Segetibacter aerophilus TaxID=670293 RepID=A0A512BJH9_9BACT|nr:alpha-1,2-fucosyltransferase [Segetibacter aerophilus]GEO12126.1 alpha-1,2-fucosyltransferase [Segetibacter aerophilus]